MDKDDGWLEIRPGVWAGPAPDLSMTQQERVELANLKRSIRIEKILAISGVLLVMLAMSLVSLSLIFNISGPVMVPLGMFFVGDTCLIILSYKKEAREKKLKDQIVDIVEK